MGGILEAIGAIFIVLGSIIAIIAGAVIGIGEGFFKTVDSYFRGLRYSIHKGNSLKTKREFYEPAKEKYFFYKQYEDLNNTYKSATSVNKGKILVLKQQLINGSYFTFGRIKAAQFIIYIIGNVLNAICFFIHFLIITIISIPIYIFYFIVIAMEKIKFTREKISGVCPYCHIKFDIPYYICPSCGKVHKRLEAGPYGIMKRTCECGEVIPSTNFAGRAKLRAVCPRCSKSIESKETSPICIPIIGGVSAGKTSFMYSALNTLINDLAKAKKWNIRFLNEKEELKIRECLDTLNKGILPRKTIKQDTVPYSVFINSDKFRSEKLLYMYDIAGEYFDIRASIRRHNYYKYTDGLIFIIDPLSIEGVVKSISEKQEFIKSSPSNTNVNDLLDRFILGLREVKEIELNKLIDIPVAVIVNKMDVLEDQEDIIQFLKDSGEEKLIRKFEHNFSNYQFFSCSSLGHSSAGEPYESQGIFEPVEWILGQINQDMK